MRTYLLIVGFCLFAVSTQAQKVKDLGNEEINVVKPYEPTLSEAFKITGSPAADKSTFKFPELTYSIEPIRHSTNFNTSPIKAVRIKDKSIKKLYNGFVKAGYGNYNSPLLQFRYNTLRSKKHSGSVYFHHLSSTPARSAGRAIKGVGYPGFSNSGVEVKGTKFFDETKLGAGLAYDRQGTHFYGYDVSQTLYSKSETRRVVQAPSAFLEFASHHNDDDRFRFESGVDFYHAYDNRKTKETGVGFHVTGKKRFNEHQIKAGLDVKYNSFDQPVFSAKNRSFVNVTPRYIYDQGLLRAEAGVNLQFTNEAQSEVHFYPHIDLNFEMIDDALSLYGILSGNNNYLQWRDIVDENPFVATDIVLESPNHKFQIGGGLRGKVQKNLSLVAGVKFERITDEYFYLNTVGGVDPVRFTIVNDDVNHVQFHGEMEYAYNKKINLRAYTELSSYEMDKLDKPYHKPLMRLGVEGTYNLGDKIYVRPALEYSAKTYAFDHVNLSSRSIDPWVDFSLGLEYRYSKILSFWGQMNNLGFAKYQRYYNYPSYRFNGMVGLSYSF